MKRTKQPEEVNVEDYMEKPRPNLFNVIKKLRDNKRAFKRFLIVGKVNQDQVKPDSAEKEFESYYGRIAGTDEISGLLAILGNQFVHFLETDGNHGFRMLKQIEEDIKGGKPCPVKSAHIITFTEEKETQVFPQNFVKSLPASGSNKEMKEQTTEEQAQMLYDSFLEIGRNVTSASSQSADAVSKALKMGVGEHVPAGDELDSMMRPDVMDLQEFNEYICTPPDILLEKELVWPGEPDLVY